MDRVRVPKASDVLADQLRRRILEGDLEPGAMLPNERALAEESRLSRTSVREALRILEIDGLVATRPGRNGGTVVRRPDADSVAHTLDVFIRGRRVRIHDVLEIREEIEPICAGLAAERRTDEDLAELDDLTRAVRDAFEDVPRFLTTNVAWHLAVARAGHNELLATFMLAISNAVRAATDIEDFNSDAVRAGALKAHDRVIAAIRTGDADAARESMRRHVHAYREQLASVPLPDELDLERR
jgi:GntR family transcriptional regulator, transcriptional repressor for pyruvate dehydrogenase complex